MRPEEAGLDERQVQRTGTGWRLQGCFGRESWGKLPVLSPSHPLPGDRESDGPGLGGTARQQHI